MYIFIRPKYLLFVSTYLQLWCKQSIGQPSNPTRIILYYRSKNYLTKRNLLLLIAFVFTNSSVRPLYNRIHPVSKTFIEKITTSTFAIYSSSWTQPTTKSVNTSSQPSLLKNMKLTTTSSSNQSTSHTFQRTQPTSKSPWI